MQEMNRTSDDATATAISSPLSSSPTTTPAASSIPNILEKLEYYAKHFPEKKVMNFLSSGGSSSSGGGAIGSISFGGKVEQSLTYAQLQKQTENLKEALLQKGLQPGDRYVCVCARLCV